MSPASSSPVCELAIGRETLSAWRDEALPAAEAAALAQHITTCAACQATLAEFAVVGHMLAAQSVPPVPPQVWPQVRQAATRRPRVRVWRRWQTTVALGVALTTLAVIVVAALIVRVVPFAPHPTSAPSGGLYYLSAPPTVVAQPFDQGLMYDAAIGNDLSFAYVERGTLTVRLQGQTFNVPLAVPDAAGVRWGIAWAPDQSRLLVTAQQPGKSPAAWMVYMPNNAVTVIPATSPLASSCAGNADGTMPCQWLLDRYILYPQQSASQPAGATVYGLYDLQTQQVVPSALDHQTMQFTPVVRGPYVFFTPFGQNSITRFDNVTNSVVSVFTNLPGAVLGADHLPAGGWSLSADAQSVFFVAAQPSPPDCGTTIDCYSFYLRANTTIPQSPPKALDGHFAGHYQDQTLSPDGHLAVALILGAQGEQVMSAYQFDHSGRSPTMIATLNVSGASTVSFLGWAHTQTGETALIRQVQLDAAYQPTATTIVEMGNALQPVMTVTKSIVVFAPPYET